MAANIPERPGTPEPISIELLPNGALPGNLPLSVPRLQSTAAKVVIVARDEETGITAYEVIDGQDTVQARINTRYEVLLNDAVCLFHEEMADWTVFQVKCGLKKMSWLIAAKNPLPDPVGCHIVDHKNRATTDNFEASLHWVLSQFNAFNRDKAPTSGHYGV